MFYKYANKTVCRLFIYLFCHCLFTIIYYWNDCILMSVNMCKYLQYVLTCVSVYAFFSAWAAAGCAGVEPNWSSRGGSRGEQCWVHGHPHQGTHRNTTERCITAVPDSEFCQSKRIWLFSTDLIWLLVSFFSSPVPCWTPISAHISLIVSSASHLNAFLCQLWCDNIRFPHS